MFGSSDNFRREKLTFHLAPFTSSYQALLGREAFARFNAIPHYTFLALKMPGPRGIISLKGVMPDLYAHCTGSLLLEVVLGSSDNFRREKLTFHIAPFKSNHQALLGREAFARFNAIPHYASLTLKMLASRGIISLKGNTECSLSAEDGVTALTATH